MSGKEIADYIFYDGNIITMDEEHPTPEALAVKKDKIVGVGNMEEIVLQWMGDITKTVSLKGQTLMPGLIEAHQHAVIMTYYQCQFEHIDGYHHETYEEVKHIITEKIRNTHDGETAVFFGWDAEITQNMPKLDKYYIDAKFTKGKNVGVIILGQSGHIGWANQKALEKAGISPEEVDHFMGGVFARDSKGELTGEFFEYLAFERISDGNIPRPSWGELEEAFTNVCDKYAAAGFTAVTDIAYSPTKIMNEILQKASSEEDCLLRVALYKEIHEHREEEYNGELVHLSFLVHEDEDITPLEENNFLWVPGIKFYADGSPHSGTMAIQEPYLENNVTKVLGFPEAPNYGGLDWSAETMNKFVKMYHEDDSEKQIAIHAHGERACEQVLNAFEKVLLKDPVRDRRHRMEHVGLITEDQIKRAANLNLGLSFFVNHLYFYATPFAKYIFGRERTNRWAPCSLGTKYGVRWTLHQDQPTHPGPPKPFVSIQTAVTRTERFHSNTVYGPEYCVSVHEALKAYTIDAAWQLKCDDKLGSLAVGKYADLLILAENPYKVDKLRLEHIQVLGTFIAGRMNKKKLELNEQNGIYVIKQTG